MNIREIFALNLRRSRHAKGLSQEKLAHLANIDRTYVSSLERCVYSPTIDMLATLAEILEVEPSDLIKSTTPVASHGDHSASDIGK
ncbi:helix-turn-helix domain-containing protein [Rhizobium lusitanum]|uniref:Helix-turn-helix domain-containing protein n=1 Tax=Rhizobium lusitanum TaxID=293958 RepID=A0A6L9UDF0_9HYPH|nr:helix-turn-helix transcriptional regulator [Rhizobium lusitanum]NEI73973.1 helix-turn-helix domain-containing protein [Rhizobium lusitanum]